MENFIKVTCNSTDSSGQTSRGSLPKVVLLNIDLISAIDNDFVYLKQGVLVLNGKTYNKFTVVDKIVVNL